MSLLNELLNASYTVNLEIRQKVSPNLESPGMPHDLSDSMPRDWLIVTLKASNGAQAVRWVAPHFIDRLDEVLALMLAENFPKNALYARWCLMQGQAPVQLAIGAKDCFGELLHTGLRKLTNSPESGIAWNAIHCLSDEDREAMFDAVQAAVNDLFKLERQPLRRQFADRVKETADKICNELYVAHQRNKLERTKSEVMAIKMLRIAVKATPLSDWMWAWLGYILEDNPKKAPSHQRAVKKTGRRIGAATIKRAAPRAKHATVTAGSTAS